MMAARVCSTLPPILLLGPDTSPCKVEGDTGESIACLQSGNYQLFSTTKSCYCSQGERFWHWVKLHQLANMIPPPTQLSSQLLCPMAGKPAVKSIVKGSEGLYSSSSLRDAGTAKTALVSSPAQAALRLGECTMQRCCATHLHNCQQWLFVVIIHGHELALLRTCTAARTA